MKYVEAKKLKEGDLVLYKLNDKLYKIKSIKIDKEHRDVFVQCDDNRLYHHVVLKNVVKKIGLEDT